MSSSLPISPTLISSQASRLPSFDLYGAAHRGMRWAMANLLLRMGGASPDDRVQTDRVLAELANLLDLLRLHMDKENRHYHAALERRRPDSSTGLVEDHRQHFAAIAELHALSARVGQDAARWRGLYLAYALYVAEELIHMSEEESLIQPLFEELYSKAELQKLNEELVADISPTDALRFLSVMVPAATREGRVALLEPVRAALPPGPFQGLLAALRPTLSEADFEDLAASLGSAS